MYKFAAIGSRVLQITVVVASLTLSACSIFDNLSYLNPFAGKAEPVIALPPYVAGPVSTTSNEVASGVMQGVEFSPGTAVLTKSARSVLRVFAASLENKAPNSIVIDVHTDNRGTAADNIELSRVQAIAVAKFLVLQGIDHTRLRAVAYGESRPVARNATRAGRDKNRRVEIRLLRQNQ